MMARTQELLIIVLGVIAVASITIQNNENALLLVIGILGGFLTNKTMTEKQTETLEKHFTQQNITQPPLTDEPEPEEVTEKQG